MVRREGQSKFWRIKSTVESKLVNFKDTEFINPKDLQSASLNDAIDAIDGKLTPEHIKWPNNTYYNFLELIVEGNISNKIGDKIIKFFNKHNNLDKSLLPSSMKNSKNYFNQ